MYLSLCRFVTFQALYATHKNSIFFHFSRAISRRYVERDTRSRIYILISTRRSFKSEFIGAQRIFPLSLLKVHQLCMWKQPRAGRKIDNPSTSVNWIIRRDDTVRRPNVCVLGSFRLRYHKRSLMIPGIIPLRAVAAERAPYNVCFERARHYSPNLDSSWILFSW